MLANWSSSIASCCGSKLLTVCEPSRVEHKRVVAGTADGDGGRIGVGSGRRVEDDRAAMPVRCLFQIAEVEIIYRDRPKVLYCDDSVAVSVFRKADVASRNATQIDFIGR